ncbi:MAG: prephenate dehydrogenase [Actinomycetota bacterium]
MTDRDDRMVNVADGWSPRRLALYGVGQVGTMIGLAARSRGFARQIVVADPDGDALAASRARGLRPDGYVGPDAGQVDADVIVLAAPVPRIVELVERIGPRLRSEQLLIDTGGAKSVVVEAMRSIPADSHAIGGHPMAGTEIPGAAGARPEALQGAPFVLTPARDDDVALRRARRFVEALGARPVIASAEEHDRIVARTSHLPHVAAFGLAAVAAAVGPPARVAQLSGSGFRGATRLAASDPKMVAAFLSANRAEVRAAIDQLLTVVRGLDRTLNDPDALAAMLAHMGGSNTVEAR